MRGALAMNPGYRWANSLYPSRDERCRPRDWLSRERDRPIRVRKLLRPREEASRMLLILGIILLVCWLLGLFVFKVTAGFIHLLIVIAVIVFILHFIRGRRV
jgi:hypothetical protein